MTSTKTPKITFVCCPKPFLPEFYDIQNNAIMSWTKLKCVDKIIICGTDEGVEDYVNTLYNEIDRNETEIIYIKDNAVNEFGTPLVDSLFNIGGEYSEKHVCYINSDIILLSDFTTTFHSFCNAYPDATEYLFVGKRWDWKNPKSVDFSNSDWEQTASEAALADGSMHPPSGIDYFLHSKTTFPNMPPYALGRFWWDNAIVGSAHQRRVSNNVLTVDVTPTVFCIHQNSPWFLGGNLESVGQNITNGPEARKNRSFSSFGRTIADGTEYTTFKDDEGKVCFKKK